MKELAKQLDNHIQSLKALNEEPTNGIVFEIIEQIKSTNYRFDTGSNVTMEELEDEDVKYNNLEGVNDIMLCEGEKFAFIGNLTSSLTGDFLEFQLIEILDEEGDSVELNAGDKFWIEKAINENLIA